MKTHRVPVNDLHEITMIIQGQTTLVCRPLAAQPHHAEYDPGLKIGRMYMTVEDLDQPDKALPVPSPFGDPGDWLAFKEPSAKPLSGKTTFLLANNPRANTGNWQGPWIPANRMDMRLLRTVAVVREIRLQRVFSVEHQARLDLGCDLCGREDTSEYASITSLGWFRDYWKRRFYGKLSFDDNPWAWFARFELRPIETWRGLKQPARKGA